MGPDERAIRELNAVWIEAVNAGNVEPLLGLMAPDSVFVGPGQAPLHHDQFRAHFTAAVQQSRIQCVSTLDEVVVVGDLAYSLCHDSLSVSPRAGGELTELAGHRISIYRKQPDGAWLLARDAHTLSVVAG